MDNAKGKPPSPHDSTREFISRSAQRAAVYLCYASADANIARACALTFEAHGTPCWLADRDMTPEMVWPQCVIEAIESSKYFVLVLTPHAVVSADVAAEINEAIVAGRTILTLRTGAVNLTADFESLLTGAHELRVQDPPTDEDLEVAWQTLVEIETNTTGDNAPPAAPEPLDGTHTERFLIHLEPVRGTLSGKLAFQLGAGDRLIFGRGTDVDVRVPDDRASRRHAGLIAERDPRFGLELYLMDLMSRNGTWVRYRREGDPDISKFLEHTQVRITSGAIIRIGSTDIRVKVERLPTPVVSVDG